MKLEVKLQGGMRVPHANELQTMHPGSWHTSNSLRACGIIWVKSAESGAGLAVEYGRWRVPDQGKDNPAGRELVCATQQVIKPRQTQRSNNVALKAVIEFRNGMMHAHPIH